MTLHAEPRDVHHPDENDPLVELVVRNHVTGRFTTELPGLAPVPFPVTVYDTPTAVRESWAAQIIADAATAGITVEPA